VTLIPQGGVEGVHPRVGVVAAILPWNAPFVLFAQKLAPALAAGCTVVVKPSEYATFCVLRMVELLMVDKVSFTGSRAVGKRIVAASAGTMKRVSLELGGKSPAIVFPDTPSVGLAGMTAMGMVTMGLSGQACVAHTRALVHRDV
jgi:aldehyde dehydrogenase (NAD+)